MAFNTFTAGTFREIRESHAALQVVSARNLQNQSPSDADLENEVKYMDEMEAVTCKPRSALHYIAANLRALAERAEDAASYLDDGLTEDAERFFATIEEEIGDILRKADR